MAGPTALARLWQAWLDLVDLVGFTRIGGLIQVAVKNGELTTKDAALYLDAGDDSHELSAQFESQLAVTKAKNGHLPSNAIFNNTTRTLIFMYRWRLFLQSLWTGAEVAVRLLSPLALRQFLRWLQQYAAGSNPPEYQGWLLALALGACGFAMTIIHHRLFWAGMANGFRMRQQCVAAVHAKALRLNAAAVSHVSQGHVVNLVSNDVRRFDDAIPFWIFLWAGPVELSMVLLMVSLELGFLPALAGVSATLAMLPIQAALVRPVAGIRRSTAALTDERVRLTSELIQGSLAMKMLSWEMPFSHALSNIRAQEARCVRSMARIRAVNFALQFAITPVVSFATFAVYRALNGSLSISSVFYSLSLLHLPKLYLVQFFVLGIQSCTELKVSLTRIDRFLSTEEPPVPVHSAVDPASAPAATHAHSGAAGDPARKHVTGASRGTAETTVEMTAGVKPAHGSDSHGAVTPTGGQAGLITESSSDAEDGPIVSEESPSPTAQDSDPIKVVNTQPVHLPAPVGTVALRGADYDWRRPLGHVVVQPDPTAGTKAGSKRAERAAQASVQHTAPAAAVGKGNTGDATAVTLPSLGKLAAVAAPGAESSPGTPGPGLTLEGVRFELAPGERLGVCGEGGAGKSSLLAAVLGELQPLPHEGSVRGQVCPRTGPLVVGRVAYCSQVPWIVAATVRDNITFGLPYREDQYNTALAACALDVDIAGMPAGDQTELGDRGINLSGGQKARVALARAAYARADVALLDDPLSAVDPRVARQLFNACIGHTGVMQGATRVLVTHQRQFLPKCDRVMVLRGGKVVALGTWVEVSALQLPELTAGATDDSGAATVDELTEAVVPPPLALPAPRDDVAAAVDDVAARAGAAGNSPGTAEHVQHVPASGVGEQQVAVDGGSEAEDADGDVPASLPDSQSVALRPTGSMLRAAISTVFARGPHTRHGALPDGNDFSPRAARRPGADDLRGGPDTEADETSSVGDSSEDSQASDLADGPPTDVEPAVMLRLGRAHRGSPAVTTAQVQSGHASARGGRWASFMYPGGLATAVSRLYSGRAALPGAGKPAGGERTQRSASETLRVAGAAGVKPDGRLVQDEDRIMGHVPWAVYTKYLVTLGRWVTGLLTFGMFAGQAAFLASEWWLSLWSRASPEEQGEDKWLWVYGMLTGIVIILSFSRSLLFFDATVTAATRIHDSMALHVLRAPLSFFHTNPAGRILNRFSKDLGQVDDLLPQTLFDALQVGFLVLSACVLVSIAVPVILPVFVPLAVAFVWLRRRYLAASREVKRWEAVTRSPVFAAFSATLKGLPTIRAYAAGARFQDAFLHLLTINGYWFNAFLLTSRWIGFRLDVISACTLLAAALLCMASRNMVQPRLAALALTHVLQLTGFMQWMVRQTAEVENIMTSTERMLEYTELPSEPPLVEEGGQPGPLGWPASGALEYQGVTATYRAGLPPVLVDISFSLKAGTSCGVVGRTGSGKSSLMLTLFRLIPITQGRVLLDGVDTASLGLDALRRQLSIIPQDPVLFSGTVRSNLAPWAAHTDDDMWRALEAANLKDLIATTGGLDARMSEAGENLSVGQRQLFCLARALLQRARILALDEATANVDRGTDARIQTALRSFQQDDGYGRVLLIIAHRIDTILDTDTLVVLQAGRLVEHGPPGVLSTQPGGLFAGMVAASRTAMQEAHQPPALPGAEIAPPDAAAGNAAQA